jgi:hypothetical protein
MSHRRLRLALLGIAFGLALSGAGCIFGTEEEPPPRIPPGEIPIPTLPENIVKALEVIYTDKVRTATERRQEFENLLAKPAGCDSCTAFLFDFQPADEVTHGTPDTWGRPEEVQSHENLFQAQDNGDIESLTLTIQQAPPEDMNQQGREGWKSILATNVHLRLMFNPNDGLEVNQGQAEFRVYPYGGRWWLGEWIDLPPQ